MTRLIVRNCLAVTVLMLGSSTAFGWHGSMPSEVYEKLEAYGVTFIEFDGAPLHKEGCAHVQVTSLKKGARGDKRGMAMFVLGEPNVSTRLIGVEVRDEERNPVFVWRAPDFWQIAACHFPDTYGARGQP